MKEIGQVNYFSCEGWRGVHLEKKQTHKHIDIKHHNLLLWVYENTVLLKIWSNRKLILMSLWPFDHKCSLKFSTTNFLFQITNLIQKFCKGKYFNIQMDSCTWTKIQTGPQILTVQCQLHNLSASHLKSIDFS